MSGIPEVGLTWFVGQSLVFILLAFVLGVATGRLWKAAEKPRIHTVTGFRADSPRDGGNADDDVVTTPAPTGAPAEPARPSPRPRAPR
ncbi:hypothetical protein [Actinoplanes utahensis]|nr:hypothetical protein [Actinoplanes utahensis]